MVRAKTRVCEVLPSGARSREEPIAGGRHKVFGSHALAIPPQTSTIASHLPKAVGAAVALDRAARLGIGGGGGATPPPGAPRPVPRRRGEPPPPPRPGHQHPSAPAPH